MFVILVLVALYASTLEQAHGLMPFGAGMQAAMLGGMMGGMQGGMQGTCGTPGMGKCYGLPYDSRTKMFCCDGKPFGPCTSPAGMSCCGKFLVKSSQYLCCSKDAVPKVPGSNMVCCDKRAMDQTAFICCDDNIQPKYGPNTYCCHKRSYDIGTGVCCHKDVLPKEYAAYDLSCAAGNDAPHRHAPALPPTGGAAAAATNYGPNPHMFNNHPAQWPSPPQGLPPSLPSLPAPALAPAPAPAPQPQQPYGYQPAPPQPPMQPPMQPPGPTKTPAPGSQQQNPHASNLQMEMMKRFLAGAFRPPMGRVSAG